jgi:hypothetical protein
MVCRAYNLGKALQIVLARVGLQGPLLKPAECLLQLHATMPHREDSQIAHVPSHLLVDVDFFSGAK